MTAQPGNPADRCSPADSFIVRHEVRIERQFLLPPSRWFELCPRLKHGNH
jgi:hypothetical protein